MTRSEKSLNSIFKSLEKNKDLNFETRNEQIQMSALVQNALISSEFLVVEAGTGVGKSLAYLLPACIFAVENGKKVVISTETRALQAQLLEKDIPIAKNILGLDIRAEVAYGASNYLCKRKLGNIVNSGNIDYEMVPHLKSFYEWEEATETGLKREYKGVLTGEFWNSISRESDSCLGRRCPNFSHSYYFVEKEKWKQADILIINHSLLASHISGNLKLLPEFSHLIIDEAHNFPETVGKSSRVTLNHSDILKLLQFIRGNDRKNNGLLGKINKSMLSKKTIEKFKNSEELLNSYFGSLMGQFPIIFQSKRIKDPINPDNSHLEIQFRELVRELESIKSKYDPESEDILTKEILMEVDFSITKLSSYSEALKLACSAGNDYVKWLEPVTDSKHGENFYTIAIQPISSSSLLHEKCYPFMETIVFTSATLSSSDGNFEYFKSSIGNPPTIDKSFPSPFPYNKNSLLYLPKNVRDPVSNPEEYQEDMIKLIPYLLDLTDGSSFILFTSNKMLRDVHDALRDKVGYPLISQLDLGAERAKEEFLEQKNSVLLGVSSFWQGIDIKGDKLKSVIITKLPFQPPGEPILEAKIELLKESRGNPFEEIQLPYAGITLKQGFGRLIRSKTDTGYVAILDPRIQTKFYGKKLLSSLPPARKVLSFADLKRNYPYLGGK